MKKERKKKLPFSFDFNVPAEPDLVMFDPPKNPKSLLLPRKTVPQSTLLPEDFHFEAPSLAKFILRASVWVSSNFTLASQIPLFFETEDV